MHAYLITGKTQKERFDKAKGVLEEYGAAEIIDLPTPKSKHFIKDIREINHKLSLKSGEKPRGVIIQDAHLLTTEAANSFLKTLEEPPGNTIIILTAPNGDLVLPTIASRCTNLELGIRNYELGNKEIQTAEEIFEKLVKGGVGERLKFLEATGTRQDALEFCAGQIHAVRKLLMEQLGNRGQLTNPSTAGVEERYTDTYQCIPVNRLTALIDRINQTRKDLEANVNVKLSLGNLLLNYPNLKS